MATKKASDTVVVDIVVRVAVSEQKWRAHWGAKEDMTGQVTAGHIARKVRLDIYKSMSDMGFPQNE